MVTTKLLEARLDAPATARVACAAKKGIEAQQRVGAGNRHQRHGQIHRAAALRAKQPRRLLGIAAGLRKRAGKGRDGVAQTALADLIQHAVKTVAEVAERAGERPGQFPGRSGELGLADLPERVQNGGAAVLHHAHGVAEGDADLLALFPDLEAKALDGIVLATPNGGDGVGQLIDRAARGGDDIAQCQERVEIGLEVGRLEPQEGVDHFAERERCAVKGTILQRVQIPPGNCRSSR